MTQPSGPETTTGADIMKQIFKEAGVDPASDLPLGDLLVWYGHPTDPSNPLEFRVGQASPLLASHTVVGLFHDEDEYRVYTLDLSGKPPKSPKDGAPRCFHFSKKSPTYFAVLLPSVKTFVTAMALDWSVVAYDMQPVDRVRIEIAEYIRESKDEQGLPTMTLEDLAKSIESGEYEEEEEEEEDDDDKDDPEPEPGTPTPTPGASSPGVQ